MKRIIALFILPLIFCFTHILHSVKTNEQELVEKSVLEWADKTFEYYDGARFEKFVPIPSDQFAILESKVSTLKEYKDELKANFAAGEINKSKEDFDKSIQKLERKIDSLSSVMVNLPGKSLGFEIDFWANIMVNNALTVYYVHHIKLDNNYVITEAKITGSIGKENDQIKILYKKGQGK